MSQPADEKTLKSDVTSPDFSQKFDVRLFGLTLNRRDNFVCILPVILAVLAQIRFNTSFMAEGGFAFVGVIGYIAMRLWLVNRRYPEPGQLELFCDRLVVPASINGINDSETFFLKDITRIILFIYRGRHGENLTSLHVFRGMRSVAIPGLSVELEPLVRALEEKGLRCERQAWFPVNYIAAFVLIGLLFVAFILWNRFN